MFGQASRSQGVSRTLTGVHIIGGVDIDCNNLLRHKVPDLKTEGGALFGGSVAVLGDMCISGTLSGNVGGNLSGNLMGDITVEGDLDVGGNLTAMDGIISNLETDVLCVNDELFVDFISAKDGNVINIGNIELEGNMIPEQDLTYDLGSLSSKFRTIYTDDIVICGTVSGNLNVDISNVTSLTLETLNGNVITGNTVCVNQELQTDMIVPKGLSGNIIIGGSMIPSMGLTYDLGGVNDKWGNAWINNLTVCNVFESDVIMVNTANIQTLFVKDLCGFSPIKVTDDLTPDPGVNLGNVTNVWGNIYGGNILGDFGCITEVQTDKLSAKTGNILLQGNLIPDGNAIYSMGSFTNKIKTIIVDDLVVCGTLSGNVNIQANVDIGNVTELTLDTLTANVICATTELQTDVINEKTMDAGVTVDGVVNKDSNVTAEIVTANIIDAPYLLDYKRTIVDSSVYMIDQSDDIVAVKATANGAVTVTLPLISSMFRKRKRFAIVDEAGHAGANSITILTTSPDKIFAGGSWMLSGDFNAVQIYSDEVDNWYAI